MECGDSERATTDKITKIAENLGLRGWKVGNLAAVLLVLSIAEGNDALYAVLDVLGQVLYGTVAYSRSLAARVSLDQ